MALRSASKIVLFSCRSRCFQFSKKCNFFVSRHSFYYHNKLSENINLTKFRSIYTSSNTLVRFNLADIGEGIKEVTIKEWYIKVGDSINQFDNICEVQSDKATVTITSRYDGVVKKLYHDVDATALVGQPLIDIEINSDSSSTALPESSETTDEALEIKPTKAIIDDAATTQESIVPIATPAVRRIAMENNIKLSEVSATGPGGRVLKEDIMDYLKTKQEIQKGTSSSKEDMDEYFVKENRKFEVKPNWKSEVKPNWRSEVKPNWKSEVKPNWRSEVKPNWKSEVKPNWRSEVKPNWKSEVKPNWRSEVKPNWKSEVKPNQKFEVKLNPIQKAMFKTMTMSGTIPQFTFCDDYNVTNLYHFIQQIEHVKEIRLTMLTILIKAMSISLKKYPIINSTYDPNEQKLYSNIAHNIGFAIDTPQGLVVPNIKNVEKLSLNNLLKKQKNLIELARGNKLQINDLQLGTITISNIGSIGGIYMQPLILPPQSVIMATGKAFFKHVMSKYDEKVNRQFIPVSLSADHRIIDGATLARFSNEMKSIIENPNLLCLD